MTRRRRMPEHVDNHERWLVSYADFITLLFALFVVMYSTTQARKEGVDALSDAILEAFNLPVTIVSQEQEPEELADLIASRKDEMDPSELVPLRPPPDELGTEGPEAAAADVDTVADALEASVGELAVADEVNIRRTNLFVEIDIPAGMIFPSGSRVLLNDAVPLLQSLAEGLAAIPNRVGVQVHTDSQFIDNGLFESNWELTTGRAAVLARELVDLGLDPARISATGFAEFRPVADNSTDEGRASNRRIVLRIPALRVSSARTLQENLGLPPEGSNG
ncbi:MAG: flagellar motor protein MotB [Pseudomonadota bacterium]